MNEPLRIKPAISFSHSGDGSAEVGVSGMGLPLGAVALALGRVQKVDSFVAGRVLWRVQQNLLCVVNLAPRSIIPSMLLFR
jgi:hypothetical protein